MNTLAFLEGLMSPGHLLLLGVFMLLVFGRRLPEVGRNLGRGITEFKKGMRDVTAEPPLDEPEQPAQFEQQPRQQTRAYMPPQQPQNYAPRLQAQPPQHAPTTTTRTSRADLVD